MLNVEFYDLLMEVAGALGGAMSAVRARLAEPVTTPPPLLALRGGYAESPGWFLVQAAEFDPEPLTVARLRVRDVYASERLVRALLELMASEGWLDRRSSEEYVLDEAGRAILTRSGDRQRRACAELTLRIDLDLARVEAPLARLVVASLAAPAPPGAWCLAHSRRRAPAADAPALVRVRQYLDDFNAFRDDAHMAAWQPEAVSGYAWEAFALLCSGEAGSAGTVFAQLAHRGYPRGEYAAALAALAGRGWLAPAAADTYQVTPAGRAVRAGVEARTDAYFYAPWAALPGAEIAALHAQLLALRDALAAVSE